MAELTKAWLSLLANVVGFQKHDTRAMSHIPRFSEAHVSDSSCMACRSCLTNVFFYSNKILKH